MSQRIEVEITAGAAWIRMDDRKVNAMSLEMIEEIGGALDVAERAASIPVLVGREGIFSAGFDLGTFARGAEPALRMVLAGARLIERLLAFPRPVVAACTGHAYPMGAFLMLSADVRFGIAGPYRIGMNEVAVGLTVPRFAIELARHRLTPPGLARITTAALFGPEEARRLGYLDHVVAPNALEPAVAEEVERLRGLDAQSYAATKARVNERVLEAIHAAIQSETEAVAAAG